MRNFKAKGGSVQDINYMMSSRTSLKANDQSSDSDVEAIVNKGVHAAYTVADNSWHDNSHPYAISLLLSLSHR